MLPFEVTHVIFYFSLFVYTHTYILYMYIVYMYIIYIQGCKPHNLHIFLLIHKHICRIYYEYWNCIKHTVLIEMPNCSIKKKILSSMCEHFSPLSSRLSIMVLLTIAFANLRGEKQWYLLLLKFVFLQLWKIVCHRIWL